METLPTLATSLTGKISYTDIDAVFLAQGKSSAFDTQMQLNTSEGLNYSFKKKNWLGMCYRLFRDGHCYGKLSFDWLGRPRLKLKAQDGLEYDFKISMKGLWENKYVVRQKDGSDELLITSSFNWRTFSADYQISKRVDYLTYPDEHELMITALFAVRTYYHQLAGTGAAMI